MEDTRDAFGEAILIDMHSMPHEAIDAMSVSGVRRPDVVIGDRFGAAAAPEIVGRIEAAFEVAGLKVMRNSPFAGAYITQAYGRPGRRQHVVQVEIDRSLYMNERDIRPNGNFQGFRRLLSGVLSQIADIGRPEFRLAAE
jgi:N-formylglutamate deformylase